MTKRVAIFAGYNRYPAVEDYVLYYLNGLKEVVDEIIYVADNESSDKYLSQITPITKHIILSRHGEYDFGSWKKGLELAYEKGLLDNADELVLCNDSCYGPIFPFAEMFAKMADKPLDFWGVTINSLDELKHIQSYFTVYKKNVFNSELFINFFKAVKKEKGFWDVVTKYEVGISQTLSKLGEFKFGAYCEFSNNRHNPTFFGCSLIEKRCPLLKRKIYTNNGNSRQSKLLLIFKTPNQAIKKYLKDDFLRYMKRRTKLAVLRFLYQDKVTKSGNHIIKICKIPIIHIKQTKQLNCQ